LKTEVKIAGLGGQGVILAAEIIGRAACIYEDMYATMTRSFGPEARGSSCSAQIIISNEKIHYPYLKNLDVLVVMSQDSLNRFIGELREEGTLIYEEDLVKVGEVDVICKMHGIPATRLAEGMGRKIVMNIVIVGFFTRITDLIKPDSIQSAIRDSVPPGTERVNLQAFELGYNYLDVTSINFTP
jgi:2-oxoglutarate ferredoxin oxidoreductase subunit gamma